MIASATLIWCLVIITCVLLSGFFAGSETGAVSVNRVHLRHLIRSGNKRAERLAGLLVRLEGVVVATLIGTNVFNVAAAAITTAILGHRLGSAAPAVATIIITPALLVFGEVIPKTYFRLRADTVMLSVCAPLRAATGFLAPFVWLASLSVNIMFRLTGKTHRNLFVTREELKSVLRDSAKRGTLRIRDRDMLHAVLDFSAKTAGSIMIPLERVASIEEGESGDALKALVRERGHTRILVYRERISNVVGFVNVFDVLYAEDERNKVAEFIRSIRTVPQAKRLDTLLIEMLGARTPMAVVADPLGSSVGIVTVEDIVEEIMGELIDEHQAFMNTAP